MKHGTRLAAVVPAAGLAATPTPAAAVAGIPESDGMPPCPGATSLPGTVRLVP